MSKRIFVTGGAGFVGSAVIHELLARNFEVCALVNHRDLPSGDRVTAIRGDLFDSAALDRGLSGCDGVIHHVGIIMEKRAKGVTFEHIHVDGTKAVEDAARRNGVKRYIHMSALGTRPNAASQYHQTKYKAEEYVKEGGLDWTIFRPSMIHGPGGDFMKMEAKWARKKAAPFLFMPYFGAGLLGMGGAGKLQPVYVKDVARAFVDALENPQTIGKTYELAGAQQMTWPEMHRISAKAITGKSRWVMPLPVWKAKLLTRIVPASWLPFNRDQVVMSQEDNTAEMAKFSEDFGWMPGGFEEQLKGYANEL
jgi:NADH dehydrogenase